MHGATEEVAAACAAAVATRLNAGPLAEIEALMRRQEELLVGFAHEFRATASATRGRTHEKDASSGEGAKEQRLAERVHEELFRLHDLSLRPDAWPCEEVWNEREAGLEHVDSESTGDGLKSFATKPSFCSGTPQFSSSLSSPWVPQSFAAKVEHLCASVQYAREPERIGYLTALVHSRKFQALVSAVILCNCAFSIFKADYDISAAIGTVPASAPPHVDTLEHCFIAFLALECGLQLSAHRLYFFVNEDSHWNCFDFFLVVAAVLDWLSESLGQRAINPTFLRAFRLLKVVRVVRLFRVMRVLKQLRLMMKSMVSSCGALFWSILMMLFLLTIFSLVCLQGLTLHIRSQGETMGSDVYAETDEYNDIMQSFGSVLTAMLTFYQATTGGVNWSETYDVLVSAHILYGIFFVLYIAFFYFAVTNVLTGIIVENIEKLARKEDEDMVLEFHKSQNSLAGKVKKLYKKFNTGQTGLMNFQEFSARLEEPIVQAYFKDIDVEARHAELFFRTLVDLNGGADVDIDTFLTGCERLRGFATSIDIQCLVGQMRHAHHQQRRIMRRQERAERLCAVALAMLTSDTESTARSLGAEASAADSKHAEKSLGVVSAAVPQCGEAKERTSSVSL